MATLGLIPNKENCSLEELERAIKCTPTQQNCMRLTAMRALLLGQPIGTVATIFNASLRTVSRWITAFNKCGIDGLLDRPRTGRPPAIAREKVAELRQLIEKPSLANETHWTAHKFHGYLTKELGETVGYSTVVRWLHEQNYNLRVPRPWPDRQDEEQRRVYVGKLQEWLMDEGIELWFTDESGFEGDPRPRRRWVQKGSRPTRVKNGDHLRSNVIGAICPRTGEFAAIETPECNTDWFQLFLDEAQKDLTFERSTNLLIMDNASWHKTKSINWGKFTPIYLPPYSPDFNPIERLWLVIKAEWFSDFVARDINQLVERIQMALQWVIGRGEGNSKTCTIKTEL